MDQLDPRFIILRRQWTLLILIQAENDYCVSQIIILRLYEKRGDKRVRYKTDVQNMDLSRNPETESSSHFPLLPENQQKERYALDSRLGGF